MLRFPREDPLVFSERCRFGYPPWGWAILYFQLQVDKGPDNVNITALYRCTGRRFTAPNGILQLLWSLIIWKGDPLEIQYPKFENSRLALSESIHQRYWKMRHPSPSSTGVGAKPTGGEGWLRFPEKLKTIGFFAVGSFRHLVPSYITLMQWS